MRKNLLKFVMLCLVSCVAMVAQAQAVTATWDFKSMAKDAVNIQGKVATLPAVNGIELTVDATNNGKLWSRGTDAQFTAGTIIQVPVKTTNDEVTIVSYPDYYHYTVGGTEAKENTTTVKAKSADVKQGYVAIVATAECYIYSVSVTQQGALTEKPLYKKDFPNWKAIGDYSEGTYTTKTKYSKEDLTFTTSGINVYPSEDSKKIGLTTGYIMAGKYTSETTNPVYMTTSALKNVTKVVFTQYATGSNRGWKVYAKGDGDADWVLVSDKAVSGSKAFTETTAEVNRNNVQLKFVNLVDAQNAYMSDLTIYGSVDLSNYPALESFTANGQTYVAADVFEEDANGNYTVNVEVSKSANMISKSNPITTAATAGTVGTITYTDVKSTTNGSKTETTVKFPMTLGSITVNYVINFTWKPDYTVNYYDVDGTTLVATQKVEKDAAIKTLNDGAKVTVAKGDKFRGWMISTATEEKATANTVIDANPFNLYALTSDIECDEDDERHAYDFRNKSFDPADHEGLDLSKANGEWHDTTHGYTFAPGSIDVKLNGNATVIISACAYGKPMTVKDAKGNTLATIEVPEKTEDGKTAVINYKGAATTLTISYDGGSNYIHYITVINETKTAIAKNSEGYYVVKAGDGDNFLSVLDMIKANEDGTSRVKVFLPNGTYSLGKAVETDFPVNNVSIIGQDADKTIIVTTPDKSKEGLGSADMFYNTKEGIYFQDVTLKNALDYYNCGSAGRAAVIQDRGNKTIYKNVNMLSYQDTYYSQNSSMQSYFDNCDIHGTVDFICGGGDVRFQDCTISLEPRAKDGTGGRTITAPTTTTNFGYVFDNCKIVDLANGKGDWNFGRTWQSNPICVYLNTTLDANAEKTIVASRWTEKGMNNTNPKVFGEYGTKNESGKDITPATKEITSYDGKHETILNATQAANYAYAKMYTSWDPKSLSSQVAAPTNIKISGNKITWTAVANATAYAVFCNGEFVAIVKDAAYDVPAGKVGKYTVRSANSMGGFGAYSTTVTGINDVEANGEAVAKEYYTVGGVKLTAPAQGINIVKITYADGTQKTSKVIVK